MRILIIEDDPMVAMIHKEYFKRKEISNDLNHVSTIEEAKEFLANSDIDLIVLDKFYDEVINKGNEVYLYNFLSSELAIIGNTLYARNAYKFKKKEYQKYFGEKS